ncbi:RHS repeat domain-containing protein [Streptomyces sp. NPDC014864]|uniref:RHS repeat domain-containing protein n=1 Tax=Streptomyces sp. NPDC014864 TaxID=3364924 RepID=UPI003703234D
MKVSSPRAVEARTGDGAVTFLRYDAVGRLVEAANPDSTVTFGYDAVGRILAETVDGRMSTVVTLRQESPSFFGSLAAS